MYKSLWIFFYSLDGPWNDSEESNDDGYEDSDPLELEFEDDEPEHEDQDALHSEHSNSFARYPMFPGGFYQSCNIHLSITNKHSSIFLPSKCLLLDEFEKALHYV